MAQDFTRYKARLTGTSAATSGNVKGRKIRK